MKKLWYLAVSMRAKQWTKNVVLFAGVVFSKRFTDPELVRLSLYGFLVFCGLSGAIYILNDVFDRDRDREHPKKKVRPIAAGRISPGFAVGFAVILIAVLLPVAWTLGREFFFLALAFVGVNLAYSLIFRHVVILDVISISFSFLIRAVAGVAVLHSVIPDLEFSPWLWICTLFLSLFLAICKRRNEITNLVSAGDHRTSLREYSVTLLDQLVSLSATASIISYSIYTVWPSTVLKFGTKDLVYTIPFVVFGLMRYLYLVYSRNEGGDPSGVLLTEKAIIIDVVLWFAAVVYIIIIR
jgi:4-hydroxybenzoate polyprenyltransferase